jgi:hypothetical protein
MTKCFRMWIAVVMVSIAPGLAAAQEFDTGKIRVGQTVLVRDLAGAETKGVVQSADRSKLVVKYGVGVLKDPRDPAKLLDDTRVFTPAEVDRVRRPGPIWDGAVKGAAIALVPALLVMAIDCYGSCGLGGVAGAIVGIGAGAGIGIDALWGPKTVYRNRGARRVALVPVIGKDRRGMAASIRF